MSHHDVNAVTPFFMGYVQGTKPWSIRRNDRDYQPGDTIRFWHHDGVEQTGPASPTYVISAVWRDVSLVPDDYVVLSLAGPLRDQEERS